MKCGSFIRLDFYRPHSQLIWLLLVVNAFSAPHFDWLVGRTNDFGEPFHFNKYYDYTTVWPQNFYVFNVGNENKKLTEINSSTAHDSFLIKYTHKRVTLNGCRYQNHRLRTAYIFEFSMHRYEYENDSLFFLLFCFVLFFSLLFFVTLRADSVLLFTQTNNY